jgi:hypothetical protein
VAAARDLAPASARITVFVMPMQAAGRLGAAAWYTHATGRDGQQCPQPAQQGKGSRRGGGRAGVGRPGSLEAFQGVEGWKGAILLHSMHAGPACWNWRPPAAASFCAAACLPVLFHSTHTEPNTAASTNLNHSLESYYQLFNRARRASTTPHLHSQIQLCMEWVACRCNTSARATSVPTWPRPRAKQNEMACNQYVFHD